MFVKQFYLDCLSQASYMVGSAGEAAVIDPRRDVGDYIQEAEHQGVVIRHVLETHFHADFVSGHRELAERTGASIYFGRRAEPAYPAILLADGDEIRVGKVILRALETPGHTPESVCYLVIDTKEGDRPFAILTGDTLFVGEVGRPDLVGSRFSAEEMAGMLFDSLQEKVLPLPDDVIVYPGHGPGSACGRNIGPDTASTIGKERQFNHALQIHPHDVQLNREGPASLEEALGKLVSLTADEVARMASAGEAQVIDTRSSAEYGQGHILGSLNIGLEGRYAEWAGTVLGPSTPLILVCSTGREREAAVRLARIGYENIVGLLEGGMPAWRAEEQEIRTVRRIDAQELRRLLAADEARVFDVRSPGEWNDGHIEGAIHLPLKEMVQGQAPVGDGPFVLFCGTDYRSSIACGLLERMIDDIEMAILIGGMGAWKDAKLPLVRPDGD